MNEEKLLSTLKQYFGYDSFRPHQQEIIETALNGSDSFVLMPTGGGKSICYQLPALLREGLTVVVSPLIALMKDQVEALKANGISAAFLNSSLSGVQQQEVESKALSGELKLLYVSPEKVLSSGFFSFMRSAKVSFFAIDEAHCISAWGHDFRPEYTQLALLKKSFPEATVMALTATADKVTRNDIVKQLGLQEPKLFSSSFDRPNIKLRVLPGQKRFQQISNFISQHPYESGIIYCLSRKTCEDLSAKLNNEGFNTGYYHAGLSAEARNRVQNDFQRDKTPIICATIAFGMGIDKPNVRWVIHYNLPKNMESYYQEIGRSGRDGLKSEAMLFYSFADVMRLRDFMEESEMKELWMAKLQRIQDYAEAAVCRRKILLSYFGEHLEKDCGNCDVCQNPPQTFDGTVIAQKALSAVARLNEEVPAGMLVDVLRGSRRVDLLEKGYDKIKTYGAGKDVSYLDWQQYLLQLLHQGIIEIAYDENHALKLTEASKEVLFNGRKVKLVQPQIMQKKKEETFVATPTKSKKELLKEDLFQHLRELRKQIADSQGVPPFVVFGDTTLQQMAEQLPVNKQDFGELTGVGQQKLKQYGDIFIKAVIDFIVRKTAEGEKIKGGTSLYSWSLYNQGKSLQEIATLRKISADRIYDHLAQACENGLDVNILDFLSEAEYKEVIAQMNQQEEDRLKPVFEHFEEKYPYGLLRLLGVYYNGQVKAQ